MLAHYPLERRTSSIYKQFINGMTQYINHYKSFQDCLEIIFYSYMQG